MHRKPGTEQDVNKPHTEQTGLRHGPVGDRGSVWRDKPTLLCTPSPRRYVDDLFVIQCVSLISEYFLVNVPERREARLPIHFNYIETRKTERNSSDAVAGGYQIVGCASERLPLGSQRLSHIWMMFIKRICYFELCSRRRGESCLTNDAVTSTLVLHMYQW
ncbi:hypothetical protein CBL_11802 [Carabus blaptoides fortunei]